MDKKNVLSLIHFVPLDQTTKIKKFHMVASENPDVVEGRRRLIATDVLEYEYESKDGSIDNYGADSDEEDKSGSGEAGVRTGATQSGTEEVEEVQQDVKYSSIFSYLLKPPSYLTKGFNKNNKA